MVTFPEWHGSHVMIRVKMGWKNRGLCPNLLEFTLPLRKTPAKRQSDVGCVTGHRLKYYVRKGKNEGGEMVVAVVRGAIKTKLKNWYCGFMSLYMWKQYFSLMIFQIHPWLQMSIFTWIFSLHKIYCIVTIFVIQPFAPVLKHELICLHEIALIFIMFYLETFRGRKLSLIQYIYYRRTLPISRQNSVKVAWWRENSS